eukprot:365069-Chlamydomonas_euryale.AAC.25
MDILASGKASVTATGKVGPYKGRCATHAQRTQSTQTHVYLLHQTLNDARAVGASTRGSVEK